MDWKDILNYHLINFTDDLSGFQYYNIPTKAALINLETGKLFACTTNFNSNMEEFKSLIDFLNKLCSLAPEEIEKFNFGQKIKVCDEIFEIVHFDTDSKDMFLKRHLGGGVISSADYSESSRVLIIAIFDEQLIMKDVDGTFIKQNLEITTRAVDKVRSFIEQNKGKINENIKKAPLISDYPPSTSKMIS